MTTLQLIAVIAISGIVGAMVGIAGFLLILDNINDPFEPDDLGPV